jgi:hypothetical protein
MISPLSYYLQLGAITQSLSFRPPTSTNAYAQADMSTVLVYILCAWIHGNGGCKVYHRGGRTLRRFLDEGGSGTTNTRD